MTDRSGMVDDLARNKHGGAGVTSYYLADGLGSTTQLTDSAGAITDSYSYDVFGAPRTTTGTTANDFRYTGQQDDRNANRGLDFLRARSYDPALGRFLQKDPLPLMQRYAYVENNPANFADPSGLCNDKQRYAHPEAAKTPVPSAQPFAPEKPPFDACSSPSHIPVMRPGFPFADVYRFLTTNQCLRGISKVAAFVVLGGLSIYTGSAAAIVAYNLTGDALIASGAAGFAVAPAAQTIYRVGSGAVEDITTGC